MTKNEAWLIEEALNLWNLRGDNETAFRKAVEAVKNERYKLSKKKDYNHE